MLSLRTESKTILHALAAMLLFATLATAQTKIPATGLCNTGLTPASPLPKSCTTSTPVIPVNPESGGPSLDGNWQLATPYPSAAYNQPAPNPCLLPTFGPAWVDAPWPNWFNPDDGLSQWITPEVEGPVAAGGWYIYRTAFRVPPKLPNYSGYVLNVSGQGMVDDHSVAIAMENPAGQPGSCSLVSQTEFSGDTAWIPISFSARVSPILGRICIL